MELKYKNRAIRSVTAKALQTSGKAYGHVYCKSVELAADSREWSREVQKIEAARLCSILARTISIIKSSYPKITELYTLSPVESIIHTSGNAG